MKISGDTMFWSVIGLVFAGLYFAMCVAQSVDDREAEEAVAYSQKSPAHLYGAQLVIKCGISFRALLPRNCVVNAVGQATIDQGGAFGEEVNAALQDTSKHIRSLHLQGDAG